MVYKRHKNLKEYLLAYNPNTDVFLFQNGQVEFLLKTDHTLISGIEMVEMKDHAIIDMEPYYTMRTLLEGMLNDPQAYTSVMLRGTE